MSNQRSELSPKNKYWIPKYRYLELKNFCLQYPAWKKELNEISYLKTKSEISPPGNFSNPTELLAIKRLQLEQNINLIDSVAEQADPCLAKWIIRGITENYTYEYLKYQLDLPAGRDMYYDRYRRFFWILDMKRDGQY